MKDKISAVLKSIKDFLEKVYNPIKPFFQKYGSSLIVPTVVMLLITLPVTLALSGSNLITAPKIEALDKQKTQESLKKVMSADSYENKVLSVDKNKTDYIQAVKDDEVIGYIFTVTEKGYGGDIKIMVAVYPDLTLKAVEILDVSNETVGLGQSVTNKSFTSQFTGKSDKISVVKNGADSSKNEINAVTGATISSKAVSKAVNTALDYAKQVVKSQPQKPTEQPETENNNTQNNEENNENNTENNDEGGAKE